MLDVWTRGSAPDQLAISDPEIVNDFYRSVRMFPTGRFQGFISEQLAITNGVKPSVLTGCSNWRVILGASDVLYDPKSVLAYWRSILPDARFEVIAEGGRFLAMTHPELLVQALRSSGESDRAIR